MRIVSRSCTKSAVVVQTAEDIIEQALARQSIGVAEQMKRYQTPVDAAYAQVFGEMVLELVAALLQGQCQPEQKSRTLRMPLTESRACTYSTCLSTTNLSSRGSCCDAAPPPRPGPAASDICVSGEEDMADGRRIGCRVKKRLPSRQAGIKGQLK